MRRFFLSAALPFALAACAQSPAEIAATPPPVAAASQAQPASLAALVDQVDIPYESFTLPNGLDTYWSTPTARAPVVGVTTYYRVGSKNEPRGKTGFAHLYEHLIFGGSENVPNFDIPLEGAGSTSTNGSTWYDRTNYVETVPTGALDLALFMESDRMGHLLGAVTQDKLDKQRGVVQNEKRTGDNQPYGLDRIPDRRRAFPGRPPLSPRHYRFDGRSRRRHTDRCAQVVHRQLRAEQRHPCADRRHRRGDRAAEWSKSGSATSRAALQWRCQARRSSRSMRPSGR